MSGAISTQMSAAQWGKLALLSVLWGGTFFAVEIALVQLDPLLLVNLRVALAALALYTIVKVRGQSMPKGFAIWRAFLLIGFLNNALPFSLMFWGQTEMTSSLASILNASTPIFGVLVAGALLADEPLTRARLVGALIGLAGVTLMVGPGALAGFGIESLAQIAFIGGTISYAFAGAYGRRFAAWGISPLVTATGQLIMSSVLMLPVVYFFGELPDVSGIKTATVLAVLSLALISTAFAYLLYFQLLRSAGSSNLMLVTLLIPVTAILLGVTFLHERLTGDQLLGIAIIALGLAVIDGRLWQWVTQRRGRPQ